MKEFLIALQFLTTIPVKIRKIDEKKFASSMIFFPIVGCLLGLILIAIQFLFFSLGLKDFPVSIIVIISLIILTGGIHLDGLADSADALLSHKSIEDKLNIMRDPHIGTMGALSIISMLLLKIALLSSINPSLKIHAILLMCILSRWSLVFSIYLFPYARKEGKARVFKDSINLKIYLLATLIALGASIEFWRFQGLLTLAAVGGAAFGIGCFFKRQLGGNTGDTLGATNEISEIIVLLCFCVFEKIFSA